MSDVVLRSLDHPLDATVRPPGSKSQTNRTLPLAAMAEGASYIHNVLFADDTRYMIDALRGLGVRIASDEAQCRFVVNGCGGRWPSGEAALYCGNAGTVARFLTAAVCVGEGQYTLDGAARMRQRPISPLVDGLRNLGAEIAYGSVEGSLPLQIAARGLRGGNLRIDASDSSQYVSALLLVAPLAISDVMIEMAGPVVSGPYLRMTLKMVERFGAAVVEQDLRKFVVPATQRYAGQTIEIEPDASAASYFFGAAAITGGRVSVPGLGSGSVQGDVGFVRVLERMGCRAAVTPGATTVEGPAGGAIRGVDVDLGEMPDTAPTLAVLAAFAEGPTRIRNVANLRIKESDRIAALATELQRIGAEVEIHADGLTVMPAERPVAAAIDTYDDHRIAMSFALAGLRIDGVTIRDAECVSKTYPRFFEDWERMRG